MKLSVSDNVRIGPVKAMRHLPAAIRHVEQIRREMPIGARMSCSAGT